MNRTRGGDSTGSACNSWCEFASPSSKGKLPEKTARNNVRIDSLLWAPDHGPHGGAVGAGYKKKTKRERTKFVSFHPGWIKFPVVGIDKAKQARTAVVACSSMCTAVRYQITWAGARNKFVAINKCIGVIYSWRSPVKQQSTRGPLAWSGQSACRSAGCTSS